VTVALDQNASDLARSYAAVVHLNGAPQIEVAIPDVPVVAAVLAAGFDEPIGDPSAVAQYAICMAARLHTDDALAGHGAAALWAGYTRHRVERLEAMVRAWLGPPLANLGGLARSVQERVKGARSLSHLALPPGAAYAVKHAYGLWDDEHRHAIYTRGFAWEVRDINPFARHLDLYASRDSDDPLDRALYVDARTSLPDNTLAIADAAAVAAGIRLRYPYLDRQLMAFASTVPSWAKQSAGAGMLPVRRLIARRLPPALMPRAYRRPSRHAWLHDALAALVPPVLLGERFDGRGIISRPALRQLWEEHRTNRRDHAHRLWSLLMLEFWFREFIDGDAAQHPAEYVLSKVA
jgi:asparagine synthase (glutamine-hydrolysing)